jgi:hypothetical protein
MRVPEERDRDVRRLVQYKLADFQFPYDNIAIPLFLPPAMLRPSNVFLGLLRLAVLIQPLRIQWQFKKIIRPPASGGLCSFKSAARTSPHIANHEIHRPGQGSTRTPGSIPLAMDSMGRAREPTGQQSSVGLEVRYIQESRYDPKMYQYD